MSASGGCIFVIDEDSRTKSVQKSIKARAAFTDTVSDAAWALREREIALVSFDGEHVKFAALVERSTLVATSKRRIRFFQLVDLEDVPFVDLTVRVGESLKAYVFQSSTGQGGWVPPEIWSQVFRALKVLRPQQADSLEELDELRELSHQRFQEPFFRTVSEEKDGTGLALSFAGLRERETLLWRPQRQPAPFLRSLSQARLREDTMISHDASIFAGWSVVERYRVGAVEFGNSSQRVTIFNVNRTPIETTLGTDLLYYHHQYRAFVLVQYKRMLGDGGETPAYRPKHDKAYEREVERMRLFQKESADSIGPDPVQHYRLHSGAFYFKVCPEIQFDPLSPDLIEGMYLPLDYWLSLLDSNRAVGPHGGVAVTFDNAGRHLNNTMFTYLVQHGWIGSRSEPTQRLEELVGRLLDEGHSVLLADGRTAE